jgi:hypothetical protein
MDELAQTIMIWPISNAEEEEPQSRPRLARVQKLGPTGRTGTPVAYAPGLGLSFE